jgi:uncharacterized protein YndB with AHSA1/START domain
MMTWLAQSVKADPRSGGIFCLADLNGLWIEGTYLEVVRDRRVLLTWGGIEGLRPGQSTVEFSLRAAAKSTLRRRALAWLEVLGATEIKGCCAGWDTTRYLLG